METVYIRLTGIFNKIKQQKGRLKLKKRVFSPIFKGRPVTSAGSREGGSGHLPLLSNAWGPHKSPQLWKQQPLRAYVKTLMYKREKLAR